jgi:CRP-like cAMP-binding protein
MISAIDRGMLAVSVVFQGIAPEDLDLIVGIGQVIEGDPGRIVISEGLPGDGLYVVLQGEVEIFLPRGGTVPRLTEVRLGRLGPGRCLGEYGVIDDQPSSASARTATRTRLCFFPKADLRRLLERHDRMAKRVYANLLRFLVDRLRRKDRELLDMLVVEDKR